MAKVGTEIWEFVKKNLAILLIGTVFLIMYFGGCGPRQGQGVTKSDTTIIVVQVQQPEIVLPPYTPNQSKPTVYVTIPDNHQPAIPADTYEKVVEQLKEQGIELSRLSREYHAIRTYNDSIQLKDTAGTRVGVVKLEQVVSENILKSTQPSYQLSFPHTYTTITNTVYPKPKNQVFAGVGFQSTFNNPGLNQFFAGGLLKNKRDDVFSGAATFDFKTGDPGFKVGYYKKISFKRPQLPLPVP